MPSCDDGKDYEGGRPDDDGEGFSMGEVLWYDLMATNLVVMESIVGGKQIMVTEARANFDSFYQMNDLMSCPQYGLFAVGDLACAVRLELPLSLFAKVQLSQTPSLLAANCKNPWCTEAVIVIRVNEEQVNSQ
jgi:hypothetical protein